MEQEFHRIKRLPPYVFAEAGEGFVRRALVENRQRIRQAVRSVKAMPRPLGGSNGAGKARELAS